MNHSRFIHSQFYVDRKVNIRQYKGSWVIPISSSCTRKNIVLEIACKNDQYRLPYPHWSANTERALKNVHEILQNNNHNKISHDCSFICIHSPNFSKPDPLFPPSHVCKKIFIAYFSYDYRNLFESTQNNPKSPTKYYPHRTGYGSSNQNIGKLGSQKSDTCASKREFEKMIIVSSLKQLSSGTVKRDPASNDVISSSQVPEIFLTKLLVPWFTTIDFHQMTWNEQCKEWCQYFTTRYFVAFSKNIHHHSLFFNWENRFSRPPPRTNSNATNPF